MARTMKFCDCGKEIETRCKRCQVCYNDERLKTPEETREKEAEYKRRKRERHRAAIQDEGSNQNPPQKDKGGLA